MPLSRVFGWNVGAEPTDYTPRLTISQEASDSWLVDRRASTPAVGRAPALLFGAEPHPHLIEKRLGHIGIVGPLRLRRIGIAVEEIEKP